MIVINVAGCLAALVVLVTVIAQLNDMPKRPAQPGRLQFIRHHVHKLGRVLIGAGAGMVGLSCLAGQVLSLPALAIVVGLAMQEISHPRSWWAFVVKGQHA